ncbi:MAG: radical SAM protein [Rickettsiales bacterium]|nr:radical SAM protein [Rickettsiales bacterium]
MEKFTHPDITAKGEQRAWVNLTKLETLWLNTGTLCNIECQNCYIESSPKNDRLVYLKLDEAREYLDEIERGNLGTVEIGITGGEPFMNPDITPIMELILERGFKLLLLTNAMKPMEQKRESLLGLLARFGDQMTVRISVDHFTPALHEEERGASTWEPMLKGLQWLSSQGFHIDIAGRTRWGEDETELRAGFSNLFNVLGVKIDAQDSKKLILFPEMDEQAEVPEITTDCWDILKVNPDSMMCATSRMVIKRKGADKPSVLACTLLPYDDEFEMGNTLKQAAGSVKLNHPHCAKFCVLGSGSCSV